MTEEIQEAIETEATEVKQPVTDSTETVDQTEFLNFLKTPTKKDGTGGATISGTIEETQTEETPDPARPQPKPKEFWDNVKKKADVSARMIVRFINMFFSGINEFIINVEDPEKYEPSKQDREDLEDALSDIFEDKKVKINPYYLFAFLVLVTYIVPITKAIRAKRKSKVDQRKTEKYISDPNLKQQIKDEITQQPETSQQAENKKREAAFKQRFNDKGQPLNAQGNRRGMHHFGTGKPFTKRK